MRGRIFTRGREIAQHRQQLDRLIGQLKEKEMLDREAIKKEPEGCR